MFDVLEHYYECHLNTLTWTPPQSLMCLGKKKGGGEGDMGM